MEYHSEAIAQWNMLSMAPAMSEWGKFGDWPTTDGHFDMELHPDAGSPQGRHSVALIEGVWHMGTFPAIGVIGEGEQGLFRFRQATTAE